MNSHRLLNPLGKLVRHRGVLTGPASSAPASASPPPPTPPKKPVILYEKNLKVPSFGGSLWVTTPTNVNVNSLSPQDYPNLDQAFVKLNGSEKEQKDKAVLDLKQDGHKLIVKGNIRHDVEYSQVSSVWANIQVPVIHNLNLDVGGKGCIGVSDFLESDYVHLKAEDGDVSASRIKTGSLTIQTSGKGDIICKGNVDANIKIIAGGDGHVVGEKRFGGPSLNVSTEKGDIRVASSYSEQAKFSTNTGEYALAQYS